MKTILEVINNIKQKANKDDIDTIFKRIIGNNSSVKNNFIDFVEYEFINSKNPLFNSLEELINQWPTVDDAIDDANTLYYELQEETDKDDFSYNAFYNIVDLIRGDKADQMTELIYTILKNKLK